MPAISAAAPGKIILFGEHAVVYGRPAIAAPVEQVRTRAILIPNPREPEGYVRIQAPAVDLDAGLDELPGDHPLARTVLSVSGELGIERLPALTLRIVSNIPVASGLGSGAAVSVAIIRALSAFLGVPLPDERVSALAYEIEKLHHGIPSGIDNTVVTYALPVFFVRGQPVEFLRPAAPFTLVIGDTGIPSPTGEAVGDLRRSWQADPDRYEPVFDAAAGIARDARQAIEGGRPLELGPLMDKNHELLRQMDVSSPELDRLVEAGRAAGALGAKLSGGGRGGNMIALATGETALEIARSLEAHGAARTIITTIRPPFSANKGMDDV